LINFITYLYLKMAFNGCCTGNDMRYSSESGIQPESRLKLKSPKPSYEIIKNPNEKPSSTTKVDYKPTKETFFSDSNIPKWIELSFYTIQKKDGKKIISLHIINKCFNSKNPIKYEPDLLLYCHENETDLLRIAPFLVDISIQMKCDIVSFDYLGFGCSSGKPKITSILPDSEEALNFSISTLKYKVENIVLFGMGIGAMCALHLASKQKYQNLKSIILCMPVIGNKIIDIKILRSIFCPTLLIKEFENKNEIGDDEIVLIFREIPNEKEWLPIRKKNAEFNKNFFSNDSDYNDANDIYLRHRRKFITKIKEYIYTDNVVNTRKRIKTLTLGGSTDSETYSNSSGKCHKMPLNQDVKNKNIFNINFGDENEINPHIDEQDTNQIIDINNNNDKKIEQIDETDIEINDEDY